MGKHILTIAFVALSVTGLKGQQLFPELKGYRISDDYPVYTPDDLWNYINGAADAYLMLGFIDLNIREYVKGKKSIKAEIYRFGDDARAFGMYSMERSPGYAFIQVGVQGYNEEGAVHFYKDRYYVKIMSHASSKKVNESMLELARLIASGIGGRNEFPSLLELFPAEGLLKNQETYLLESVLGHEFLRGAFRASYEVDGDRFDIYLFSSDDPAVTIAMAAALAGDAWSEEEDPFKYAFEDGFNGVIHMARKGGRLIVVSGLSIEKTPLAERYIERMLSR
ncbi:MAG: hypothetical protein MUE37_12670 [Bacteroidales bacterium]|nr:hypothetical protein [Bacteroidales bacterium]